LSIFSKTEWRGTLLRFAPLVLWTGLIFFLSSNQGSMSETSRFIGPLLHFLFPSASDEEIQLVHFYIRKAAHVTEYVIFALIAYRAFALSPGRVRRKYRFIVPVLLAAAVASIDEFNQSFEPSRTSSPYDVLLDISGAVTALLALGAICYLKKIRRDRTDA
jgi:VanZ family protein